MADMAIPRKFRITVGSASLLLMILFISLEHLHIISKDWAVWSMICVIITVCAILAFSEYRSS
jgi:hypothetical protein